MATEVERRRVAGLGRMAKNHRPACPKYPVAKLMKLLPKHFIESLEQNQKIASCCSHPENHEVEAFYSSEKEKAPDVYKFYCTCGRTHVRFCIGLDDVRPFWDVR